VIKNLTFLQFFCKTFNGMFTIYQLQNLIIINASVEISASLSPS